ncbi:MAG: glycosyltransferase [Lachnospiraceae bacterium]|nr:glycosyltransferase [Lachnospiraceae bacterium]
MMQPKVSVIVPVYNTEPYLRKCLDSLVFQTLEEVEIVAVNDGSPDNSKAILEEYKERFPEKMQVIHKENGGQASARNLALQVCRGEYIGFLDSDDFVHEDMFEKLYNAAAEKNADYAACGYTDITYEGEKVVVLQDYVASRVAKQTRDMFFGAHVSPFLHIYKRSIINEAQVTFPEGYIYEDTAFYLNLVPYIHELAVVEEPLAVRLRRSNSTTTTFKKERIRHIMPVLKNSIDYYKANGFWDEYKDELEYFCVRVLLCSSMQRISRLAKFKDAKDLARETLSFIKEHFTNYRKNKYFKSGMTNLYMKMFNGFTMPVFLVLFRISNKFKREYL